MLRRTIQTACYFAILTSAFAQTTAPNRIGTVGSSISITTPTVTSVKYYAISMSVTYPVGLPAASYISAAQINTDFQSAIAAYPSPQDPQEAILSTAAAAILQMYPQMTGLTLSALGLTTSSLGTPLPSGLAVYVSFLTFQTSSTSLQNELSLMTHQKLAELAKNRTPR